MPLPMCEIMWLFSTPVMVWQRFFINAWKQAEAPFSSMDTLVALSTGIACIQPVQYAIPDFWHHRGLHAHTFIFEAAVIIAFILLGNGRKAKGSHLLLYQKLMGLQPKTVTIILKRRGETNQHRRCKGVGDTAGQTG